MVIADLALRDAVWCPSRSRSAGSANVLSGETRRRTASDVTRRRSAARRTPGRPHARQGRHPPRLRLRRPPPPRASPTPPSLRISTHEQPASPNRDPESWGRLCRPMNRTGGGTCQRPPSPRGRRAGRAFLSGGALVDSATVATPAGAEYLWRTDRGRRTGCLATRRAASASKVASFDRAGAVPAQVAGQLRRRRGDGS
jgi:hypothetical protein